MALVESLRRFLRSSRKVDLPAPMLPSTENVTPRGITENLKAKKARKQFFVN